MKFNINYAKTSDCVRDLSTNASKYGSNYKALNPQKEYTYRHRFIEYTWSTESKLDGWTFTGQTKYATEDPKI